MEISSARVGQLLGTPKIPEFGLYDCKGWGDIYKIERRHAYQSLLKEKTIKKDSTLTMAHFEP